MAQRRPKIGGYPQVGGHFRPIGVSRKMARQGRKKEGGISSLKCAKSVP